MLPGMPHMPEAECKDCRLAPHGTSDFKKESQAVAAVVALSAAQKGTIRPSSGRRATACDRRGGQALRPCWGWDQGQAWGQGRLRVRMRVRVRVRVRVRGTVRGRVRVTYGRHGEHVGGAIVHGELTLTLTLTLTLRLRLLLALTQTLSSTLAARWYMEICLWAPMGFVRAPCRVRDRVRVRVGVGVGVGVGVRGKG